MEKRHAKRITAGYTAKIIFSKGNCSGIIENLSETGVNIITDLNNNPPHFNAGEKVEVKFESPSGEILSLHCRIRWLDTIPPHGSRIRIGMEIIDPPWESSGYFL